MPSLRAAALPVLLLVPSAYGDVIARSPDGVWNLMDRVPAVAAAGQPWIRPTVFKPITLNTPALIAALAGAPMEFTPQAAAKPLILWFPMPDGSFARFRVVESPIMEAPLAAEFPDIRTYSGQGVDDPFATVRFDRTPLGFHSQLLSPNGAVYIDPYSRNDTVDYSVYYKRDYTHQPDGWTCLTHADAQGLPRAGHAGGNNTDSPNGTTLRTYRLACAADGEYVAFFGGTVPLGQAAVVTAINRVDGVYETELSVRMILVANNSSIIYTNASTDPYTNNNGGTMLGQNQTTCDSVIGTANYDIGHVFSTGGGGIAGLGVVTVAGNKARGVTGLGSPTGDAFYIDYVAHEMGHQFGSNHCFNSQTSNCGGGNRNASTAYEPGSASTIMGYAGICGADDLQPHSDPYFLFASLDEIISFVNSHPGNTNVATGNSLPTVNAGSDYTIPYQTPFTLTATGADANGDPVTYNWEERDLGPAATVAAGDNGTSPIIRSFLATTSPSRTIPRLPNLLANTFFFGEILPTTARTLNFRCTIRDNRADGGVGSDDMIVHVINTGAPFLVTSPNTAVSWPGNSVQTVTWNVAGTTANGINCANVAILLSTDGGNTFPTTLLASTPNNGSANVTIPNTPSSTARIKVAGAGNIFFDISNVNFTISPPAAPPNDTCANAIPAGVGSTPFTTVNANTDGPSEPGCNFPVSGDPQINQDVWFSFVAPCTGTATASTCGANYDSKIAIYAGGCPSVGSAIACNDDSDACGVSSLQSTVSWPTTAGALYTIRVGGYLTATGSGNLTLSCATCYPNCDGSTTSPVLNVNDFACFLNRYASGDTYANCDNSTTPPVLNVLDFACFLNSFAAGCP